MGRMVSWICTDLFEKLSSFKIQDMFQSIGSRVIVFNKIMVYTHRFTENSKAFCNQRQRTLSSVKEQKKNR